MPNKLKALLILFVIILSTIGLGIRLYSRASCQTKLKIQGYFYYIFFPFRNDLSYLGNDNCSSGFYEGIYEASVIQGNNSNKLIYVCDQVNKFLAKKSWNQCIFNLATNIVYSQRRNISEPSKMKEFMDSKISFCEKLPQNQLDCVVGLYTGVDLAYQNDLGDSKFPIENNDPFWLCKVGKGLGYELGCIRNTVSYLYKFANGDLTKVIEILDNLPISASWKFESKLTFFSSLAYLKSQFSSNDIQKICKQISDKTNRLACIEGYATGLDETLTPGTEASGVTQYCLNSIYSFEEKGQCIRRGFYELPVDSVDERKAICRNSVPINFQPFCNNFDSFFPII